MAELERGTPIGLPPETLQPPCISVCIATYKRPQSLSRLLTSLRPQIEGKPERELIVVNDGTHNAAYDCALAPHQEWMRYIPLAQNSGIAAARNRLAQEARGDFILYTDDDCAAPGIWADWACAALAHDPSLDVLAGTTKGLFDGREGLLGRTWAHYGLIPWPHFTDSFQRFVTACVAIRRQALLDAGGFRMLPSWRGVGEDSDLSRRFVQAGKRMRADPDWYVYHDLSDNWRSQMRRFWLYGHANAAMSHLTTSPILQEDVLWVTRRDHWSHFRALWRKTSQQSRGFSRWMILRVVSAAIAASVLMSYRHGLTVGAERNRKALGI